MLQGARPLPRLAARSLPFYIAEATFTAASSPVLTTYITKHVAGCASFTAASGPVLTLLFVYASPVQRAKSCGGARATAESRCREQWDAWHSMAYYRG